MDRKATERITLWGVVSVIATVVGIWTELPQMVADLGQGMPEWLTAPKVLWTAAIVLAYGIFVFRIWYRNRQWAWVRAMADQRAAVDRRFIKLIKGNVPPHWDFARWKLRKARKLVIGFREDFPQFLQRELGTDEHAEYMKAIGLVRANVDDPREEGAQVILAAIGWFLGYAIRESQVGIRRVSELVTFEISKMQQGGNKCV